ncbi:hypothetical protein BpHYR1_022024 [Brachionus plicatilis]|uniref:Uncharacterized protein n=1 Tax=Brachionus plicatilis TaxID=10195 RepID=A0A3M7PNE1_BRAPC|nr:hypothetical protein BpHYR1_022024 [Brachionus plicatilis]
MSLHLIFQLKLLKIPFYGNFSLISNILQFANKGVLFNSWELIIFKLNIIFKILIRILSPPFTNKDVKKFFTWIKKTIVRD